MNAIPKSALGTLLQGLSWVLIGSGTRSFFYGGRFISEISRADRFLAECEGIGLTMICGGLAFVAKKAGERLAESRDQDGLGSGRSSKEEGN